MPTATQKFVAAATQTLYDEASLASLANTARLAAPGSPIDFGAGAYAGAPFLDLQFTIAPVGVTSAAPHFRIWFLRRTNVGSARNDDGSSSILPARAPDGIAIFRGSTTGVQIVTIRVPNPAVPCTPLISNDSGSALNSVGNVIFATAITQIVDY